MEKDGDFLNRIRKRFGEYYCPSSKSRLKIVPMEEGLAIESVYQSPEGEEKIYVAPSFIDQMPMLFVSSEWAGGVLKHEYNGDWTGDQGSVVSIFKFGDESEVHYEFYPNGDLGYLRVWSDGKNDRQKLRVRLAPA